MSVKRDATPAPKPIDILPKKNYPRNILAKKNIQPAKEKNARNILAKEKISNQQKKKMQEIF